MPEVIFQPSHSAQDHVQKLPEIAAIEYAARESFGVVFGRIAREARESCGGDSAANEHCELQYRNDQQQGARCIVDREHPGGELIMGPVTLTVSSSCRSDKCPNPEIPETFITRIRRLGEDSLQLFSNT